MKQTKQEKHRYKKAFRATMDKELREHRSSFIVFYIFGASLKITGIFCYQNLFIIYINITTFICLFKIRRILLFMGFMAKRVEPKM